MNAIIAVLNSLAPTSLWSKLKVITLVSAIAFMMWQGLQMSNLRHDVTTLETVQGNLQAQVQQMSVDYSALRDNYKNTANTAKQYNDTVVVLSDKSTVLEKSFAALEVKAAKASAKADTALSLQHGTTTGVSNETSATQALTSPVGDINSGDGGSDAEWRKLLDDTYCSTYPTEPKCLK